MRIQDAVIDSAFTRSINQYRMIEIMSEQVKRRAVDRVRGRLRCRELDGLEPLAPLALAILNEGREHAKNFQR
jgi:hypothetical protein